MNRTYRRRIFWFFNLLLSFIFSGFFIIAIGFYRDFQRIPSDYRIGNRDSNVKAILEKELPFSFLVVGDIEANPRGTALIEKALKAGPASFMVILGDFVNQPDLRYHQFFLEQMANTIAPPFPVFLVAGNHDVDFGFSKKKFGSWSMTPEKYESYYGSRNFDFTFNNCLFILCCIDPKDQANYLNYLRNTLDRKGRGKRWVFVFMHNPPKDLGATGSYSLPNENEFFSLMETYKVTTCFFGDYHGYLRNQRNGTNYIISGGGGTIKSWQPEWGKFHHLLKVTVDNQSVREDVMVLPGEVMSLRESVKKRMFIYLFPWINHRGWVLYTGTSLVFLWGIYSLIGWVILLRKKEDAADPLEKRKGSA